MTVATALVAMRRVDYRFNNYCSRCAIKYPKTVFRCDVCRNKVRTKAWRSEYKEKTFRRI